MPTQEPSLLLRPKTAFALLGIGRTRGYDLLKAGAFETFVDGGGRFITRKSIEAYIARRLANNRGAKRRFPDPRSRHATA